MLKKIWHFIWYNDSLASWFVNLILAFVIVKWIIYPGIGFIFGTSFPIVAVVSGSMEHNGQDFDSWWEGKEGQYDQYNLTKQQFDIFPFKNGFNKGDIMFLKGVQPEDIKIGAVLVYESSRYKNPIIHRVVKKTKDGAYSFTTKGDNNNAADSNPVTDDQIQRTGKAVFRIPYFGWIKIWFVTLLGVG